MKSNKAAIAALALLMLGSASAWAHGTRTHVGVGFYVGPPVYYGPWYPAPYYYPPQVIVVPPAQPPVYIEQSQPPQNAAEANSGGNYWYFCKSGNAYYPYVKECPEGWQRVQPQPGK